MVKVNSEGEVDLDGVEWRRTAAQPFSGLAGPSSMWRADPGQLLASEWVWYFGAGKDGPAVRRISTCAEDEMAKAIFELRGHGSQHWADYFSVLEFFCLDWFDNTNFLL
jgi:hypothetical protein